MCAFAIHMVHVAKSRPEPETQGEEDGGPAPELPPLPIASVVPDTVPPSWIARYGSDDGR
jgi:hypothetical protein